MQHKRSRRSIRAHKSGAIVVKVESEVTRVSISVCLNYNEGEKDTSFLIEVFMRF